MATYNVKLKKIAKLNDFYLTSSIKNDIYNAYCLPIPSSVRSIVTEKNMNPLAPSSGPARRVLHQCLDLRKERRLPAPS